MDPDACWMRIVALAKDEYANHADGELLDAITDLDDWLTKGGFAPWTIGKSEVL